MAWITHRASSTSTTRIKDYVHEKTVQTVSLVELDVLGGFSKGLSCSVREMLGTERSRDVLRRMQKSVLSSSLNLASTFKVLY